MKGDQVRIKLHIAKQGDSDVKNLWMCLNYDKKPTIEHVIDHINSTYIKEENDKVLISLYLDDYWIPPYENSAILRENDVVKIEISKRECKEKKQEQKTVSKQIEEPQKMMNDYASLYNQSYYYTASQQQSQPVYYLNNVDYANHGYSDYYKTGEKKSEKEVGKKLEKNKTSKSSLTSNENVSTSEKKPAKNQSKPKTQAEKPKINSNCYKKFAIGSYVHMLNEEVQEPERDIEDLSEEQIIDDYYQNIQKKTKGEQKQQLSSKSLDVDKIVSDLKTTGSAKWKNSSKTTSQTPKHIRFPSSSSESSSSQSSSSSDEETEKKKSDKTKKFYEPSKERQLKVTSINKSTVVQNPKDMNKFNKMYNQKSLNAPKAENFVDEILGEGEKMVSPKSSPRKEKRSPSPKIDYEKFESLTNAPRVNDKIAFQILEISANFTPEISAYKNAEVIDFDSNTNEVTLKLYSKYNSILKRSSKFSVVFDETQDEMDRLKKNENEPEHEEENEPASEQELLKVDWRNLINLKLLPKNEI